MKPISIAWSVMYNLTVSPPKGEVKELLFPSSLTSSDQLVLINAISFRGAWKYAFQKDQTMAMPFRLDEVDSWLNLLFLLKLVPGNFALKYVK